MTECMWQNVKIDDRQLDTMLHVDYHRKCRLDHEKNTTVASLKRLAYTQTFWNYSPMWYSTIGIHWALPFLR